MWGGGVFCAWSRGDAMQHKTVLVAIDFGAASLQAARWAATELASDAELILVHVVRAPRAPAWLRGRGDDFHALLDELVPSLEGGLHGLAGVIGSDRLRTAVRVGTLPDALVAAAREFRADIVCVGQSQTRRGSARFGATTAHRLMSRLAVPIAIVPARHVETPAADGPAILAIDDSEQARHLVRDGFAAAGGASLPCEAIHVIDPELVGYLRALRVPHGAGESRTSAPVARPRDNLRARPTAGHTDRSDASDLRSGTLDDEAVTEATAWLDALVLGAVGNVGVTSHVRIGDPGQEIVGRANARNARLIVLGRSTASAVLADSPVRSVAGSAGDRALIPVGSTARFVTWAACCPTLVLPGTPTVSNGPPPDTHRWGHDRGIRRLLRHAVPDDGDHLPPAAIRVIPARLRRTD
jgi:nucleotide-binding universal stress UspA family protein